MTSLKEMLNKNKMSLTVSLPSNSIELAKVAIAEGADSLKVHANVNHRASGNRYLSVNHYKEIFSEIRQSLQGPLGIVPGEDPLLVSKSELNQLKDLGFDFYSIYGHHLPSWMVNMEGIEKTFAMNGSYSLSLLPYINRFPFTALEVSIIPGEEYGSPLNFKDVLHYTEIADMASIPVIVSSQRKLTVEDIPLLHQAGVKGVMIGAVVTGSDADSLKRAVSSFREAIDCL